MDLRKQFVTLKTGKRLKDIRKKADDIFIRMTKKKVRLLYSYK